MTDQAQERVDVIRAVLNRAFPATAHGLLPNEVDDAIREWEQSHIPRERAGPFTVDPDAEPGKDGTPGWAYNEDGYCVCCGNGRWKLHFPGCVLRDALDCAGATAVQNICAACGGSGEESLGRYDCRVCGGSGVAAHISRELSAPSDEASPR